MEINLIRNSPEKARQYFDNKITFSTGPAEVKEMIEKKQDMVIIDVRASKDYIEGHLPGAISLPQNEWDTLRGLKKDKQHVIYCYSVVCHLAAKAASIFASKGFSVMEMDGGMKSWKEYNYPVETQNLAETA